jgi:hypothetical protein
MHHPSVRRSLQLLRVRGAHLYAHGSPIVGFYLGMTRITNGTAAGTNRALYKLKKIQPPCIYVHRAGDWQINMPSGLAKGEIIPLQTWICPEGSRRLRLPGLPDCTMCFTLPHKQHDLKRKNITEHTMCILIFSTVFFSEILLILRIIQKYIIKNVTSSR